MGSKMAGWYLVLVLVSGHVTVNQHPMSEEGCYQQRDLAREMVEGTLAECVEIKDQQAAPAQ